ncbi:MAG: hypothetical protein H6757_00170 [Candidatus Omnitrophica bacterium]|nr:hypothetical protein [Candidatus Omnitrophota bacterium]
MNKFTQWLLGTDDFPPRWFCGHWTQLHGWMHIGSDFLIWAAYMAISVVLFYLISKRDDIPFPKLFWLFGAFIGACGSVHLIEAVIYWIPIYRISAVLKVTTAVVSWTAVLVLVLLAPTILSLPSPVELQREIERRKKIEEELSRNAQALETINGELRKRQDELEKQSREIELINEVMVGRELKMLELKKELDKYKKNK